MQRNYCFLILFLFFTFHSFSVHATQWTVTTTADAGAGSLRQSIANAQQGDSILFAVQGSIELDSSLVIDSSYHFFGPGADMLAISGKNLVRIMRIDTGTVVSFKDLTFRDGNALLDSLDSFSDGGVARTAGNVSFLNCLFIHNQGGYAGAISNSGGQGRNAELYLENCAFIENYATPELPNATLTPKSGGAIFSDGRGGGRSKIVAVNCTFSGNEATDRGGAIMHYQDMGDTTRSIVLIHCTITANTAREVGGVDVTQFGLTRYINTIVAGNQGRPDNPNVFGNLTSGGGLLLGKITFNSTIGSNLQPDDLANVEALLGPLGYYNSPIPSHSLQCGSPAIDQGIATAYTTDQKGQARIGEPDLGAFERSDENDILISNFQDAGAGSLRTAIINACGGDTLDLSHLDGSIYLESEIQLSRSVSILGNPNRVLWLRAAGGNRHLVIEPELKVRLQNLSFAEGRPAQAGGGAILNKGELEIEACTFTNNKAISGGAIANFGEGAVARLTLLNSTFSRNVATTLDGGAIDNYAFTDSAYVIANHCTFVYNEAQKRGGALFGNELTLYEIRNTILSDNQAREGNEVNANVSSQGNNLVKDGTNYTTGAGDIIGMDPMLGGLMYHGGGSYTHQLLAASPAIDAGSLTAGLSIDQRGFARVFGDAPDIGAYEYDPTTSIEAFAGSPWLLYPNPSEGIVFLEKPEGFSAAERLRVDVINIQQQFIRKSWQLDAGNLSQIRLDLAELPAGVYLIQLSVEEENHIFKLILH